MQYTRYPMKTATMPALRVHPELRQAAEAILRPGETLSGFVEDALRRNVELRRAQQAFIERGLASREVAKYKKNLPRDLKRLPEKHPRRNPRPEPLAANEPLHRKSTGLSFPRRRESSLIKTLDAGLSPA